MDPRGRHAISLFRDLATRSVDFWYIDVIGPATRRPFGFDFVEHGLDVVVQPDLATWRWKDADELEWNVAAGRYTRAEADGLYREGEHAVEHLRRDRATFERWLAWKPDPAWAPPALPVRWNEL